MMPPHVTSTELTGPTLVVHGWSLVYTEPDTDLKVVDVATDAPLPFTWQMDHEDVGEGDLPGQVQVRCTLRVTPEGLVSSRAYRLEYLGDVVEFSAG